MVTITSLQNDRIRRVRALQRSTRRRSREGLVVVEGLRLVAEAIASRAPVAEAFYTEDFAASAAGSTVVEALRRRDLALSAVTSEVMQSLSDTETPQGIVMVMPIPAPSPRPFAPFLLIPDGVRDPGNLGTMLRAAWAAGVSRVLLPPGTVDYTNPKVLRAGMGAHFYLPAQHAKWPEIEAAVDGVEVWLAEAGEGVAYDAVDWRGAVALVIGGEAVGAGPEGRALAGGRHVYIPMAPGVDSLNAAMAATVLMFEAARQRQVVQ